MAARPDGTAPGLRILHVLESSGIYGKERIVLELMRQQAIAGDVPALVSLARQARPSAVVAEAQQEGFEGEATRLHRPGDVGRLSRLIRTRRIDLVHAHDVKSSLALAPLRRVGAVPPLVRTLHGNTSTRALTRKWLRELIDRRLLPWHDALVAVTAAMRSALPLPLEVVENGIARPDPAVSGAEHDPDLGAAEDFCRDGLVLGTLARLSAEKNLEALVDATHVLARDGLPAKLIMLGEGPERDALAARIARLGVGARVWLPGFKSDVRPWLARFTLYLQPSLTEGLPIALLEAMHAGVPMMVTPVGGMNEILREGAAVPIPFDGPGIAAVVRRFWTSEAGPEEARAAVVRGRELAATRYDSAAMARAYRRLYERVLETSPG